MLVHNSKCSAFRTRQLEHMHLILNKISLPMQPYKSGEESQIATGAFLTRTRNSLSLMWSSGARGSAVGWGTALQVGRSRVRFPIVSLEFFIDIILLAALWPWGWINLYQKEEPGIFLGGKEGRCVELTLPSSCADCLEIWEPQPPGTLRACPGL